ncbi:MAG TPA: methylated-DNA--[protein]-cysteine S-methyltransferase [Baekduia sp.]|nr:methylated-DNA--[protein]-cysteine S-methyltransferase [Baekduia sp.]
MVVFTTALGTCSVQWSARGITGVALPGSRPLSGVDVHDADAVPAPIREAIVGMVALLDGEHRDLTAITLDEGDIDGFRLSVYAATRAVAPGTVATYGEIARAIGSPDAARAVGAALGSNPFPIIVPCHRVVAADGALTGFSAPGGIATKRRMLEIENVPGFAQASLFA